MVNKYGLTKTMFSSSIQRCPTVVQLYSAKWQSNFPKPMLKRHAKQMRWHWPSLYTISSWKKTVKLIVGKTMHKTFRPDNLSVLVGASLGRALALSEKLPLMSVRGWHD